MQRYIILILLSVLIVVFQISIFSQSTFLYSYTHIVLFTAVAATVFLSLQRAIVSILLLGIIMDFLTLLPFGSFTFGLFIAGLAIPTIISTMVRKKPALLIISSFISPIVFTFAIWMINWIFVWIGVTISQLSISSQQLNSMLTITIGNTILSVLLVIIGSLTYKIIKGKFFIRQKDNERSIYS